MRGPTEGASFDQRSIEDATDRAPKLAVRCVNLRLDGTLLNTKLVELSLTTFSAVVVKRRARHRIQLDDRCRDTKLVAVGAAPLQSQGFKTDLQCTDCRGKLVLASTQTGLSTIW